MSFAAAFIGRLEDDGELHATKVLYMRKDTALHSGGGKVEYEYLYRYEILEMCIL